MVDLLQLKSETSQGYFQRMLWVPVSFAIGAAVYFSGDSEPGWTTYFALVLGFVSAAFVVTRVRTQMRAIPEFALILLSFAIFGFCYSGFRAHTMPSRPIHAPFERVMMEGWISEVSGHSERMRLLIRVHAISDIESELEPTFVRVSQRPDASLFPGRFVRCFGSLQPPPEPMLSGDYDFERNAYFEGLGAVGFVFGTCEPGRVGQTNSQLDRLKSWINAQRRQFAMAISQMSCGGAGLAAAVLTGDRSFLSENDEETLRNSGLAHLLAISGLHMGLAAGVFYFGIFRLIALIPPIALRVPSQKIAGVGALMAITGYLLFSGASVATQRAYIMVVSVLLYSLFDRPLLSFQALAIAMCSVLLLAPWSVMTPGFQMSFAATAALLAGYRGLKQNRRETQGVFGKTLVPFAEGIIRTSWIAGLATMPFALFHFGRAAPLGFIANIVIMPLITLICVPLAALSIILLPFGLGGYGLEALSHALGWVLDLAERFARDWLLWKRLLPEQMPVLALICLIAATIFWSVLRRHRIKLVIAMAGLGVFFWWSSARPILIYDGAGHVFINRGTVWQELDLGNSGLRPLRFSDTEEIYCRERCSFEEQEIEFESGDDNTLSIQQRENAYSISLDDPRVMRVVPKGDDLEVQWVTTQHCRIWSSDYQACRYVY